MSFRSGSLQSYSLSSPPIVGVLTSAQTYKNLLYLALTFPLGLFYFVLLATGVPLGVGLLSIVVGLPVLIGVLVVSDRLLVFERWLASTLLDTSVPLDRETDTDDWTDYIRQPVTDLGTWIGVCYLAAKFVVGLATFVVLTVCFSVVASLILAPLYYDAAAIGLHLSAPVEFSLSYVAQFWDGAAVISLPFTITSWQVTTLWEALAVSVGGVALGIVSLHLCNLLAGIQGWLTAKAITPRPMDVDLASVTR
mgnify:CR=1 FL=1